MWTGLTLDHLMSNAIEQMNATKERAAQYAVCVMRLSIHDIKWKISGYRYTLNHSYFGDLVTIWADISFVGILFTGSVKIKGDIAPFIAMRR